MTTRAPSLGQIAIAIVFALSCFGLTLYVWVSFGGPVPFRADGYRFHALFPQAAQLTSNAEVRISGVPVGKVISATPRGLRTDAVIELDNQYAPLRSDAHAIVRTKTLLGETFIELTPGTTNAPWVKDDGRLSPKNIEPTQQLDQVLGAFDDGTRRALKRFLAQFSTALKGRGADINDALGAAEPAIADLTTDITILDHQRPALQRLISGSAATLNAIGRRSDAVQELVRAGDEVFATTASRNRALTATVDALPGFLRQLRATLGTVDATTTDAAPVLRALRPVAPLLRPGLVQASRLAPEVQRLFHDLGPTITLGRKGLPAGTRIVEAARPLVDILWPAGREIVPSLNYVSLYRKEIVAVFGNAGAATQASTVEPNGERLHYLRALAPLTSEAFVGYEQRLPSDRHNPYFPPGELSRIGHGGLRAFDCRNTSNPSKAPVLGSGSPPCIVAPKVRFQGASRQFAHVRRDPK